MKKKKELFNNDELKIIRDCLLFDVAMAKQTLKPMPFWKKKEIKIELPLIRKLNKLINI